MPEGDSEFRFDLHAGLVAEFQFLKADFFHDAFRMVICSQGGELVFNNVS